MDGLCLLGAAVLPPAAPSPRALAARAGVTPIRSRSPVTPAFRARTQLGPTVVPARSDSLPAAVPVRDLVTDRSGLKSAFKSTSTSSAGPKALAAGQRAVTAAQRIATKFRKLSPAVLKAGQNAIAAGNKAAAAAKSVPAIAGVVLGHLNLDFLGVDYTEEQVAANAAMVADIATQAAEAAADAQAKMDSFYTQAQSAQATATDAQLATANALLTEGARLVQQFDVGPGIWGPEAREAFADRKAAVDSWAGRMQTVLTQLQGSATPAADGGGGGGGGGGADGGGGAASPPADTGEDDESDDGGASAAFPDPYANPFDPSGAYGDGGADDGPDSDEGGTYLFPERDPTEPVEDEKALEFVDALDEGLEPEGDFEVEPNYNTPALSFDDPEADADEEDGLSVLGFDWMSLARGASAGLDQAGNIMLSQNANAGRAAAGGTGTQPIAQPTAQPQSTRPDNTFRNVAIVGGTVGGLALVGGILARLLRRR